MVKTIQSDFLQISIKQTGMELCSIKNKQSGKEYLWQGDPQFWTGQAPILFPIIGLLKDGITMIEGKPYSIPKHGIVRNANTVTVMGNSDSSITFQLHWDEETLTVYPFKFVFEVTFKVSGKKLDITHTIKNEGDSEMGFHLGGHPAFNCPVSDATPYSSYHIEFEHKEHSVSWLLNDDGLITDSSKSMLEKSSTLPLHNHLFDEDALIFKDLKSRSATLSEVISGDILRVDFPDFPFLGVWAKPNAPYVCIEPWIGVADHVDSNGDFMTKESLEILDPGSSKKFTYSITILQ